MPTGAELPKMILKVTSGSVTLFLVKILQEEEVSVKGDVLFARAGKMPGSPTGPLHIQCLLEQQDQIPMEWLGKLLVFPDGSDRIKYLACGGPVGWRLESTWLKYEWEQNAYVVRESVEAS